jgi:multimeric flavodoxin WrbA
MPFFGRLPFSLEKEGEMKVLLINGSPHVRGCTYTALSEVASELINQGISTQIFHIGTDPIAGCIACGACEQICPQHLNIIELLKTTAGELADSE